MTRNKTLIKGFALAALVPLFAACSSEDDAIVQGGEAQPVQINIGTRASYDGTTWQWQDNDQIGLNITNYGETEAKSYTLTYGNYTWTSNPSTINAKLPAKAEAWWPVSASASQFSFSYDSHDEAITPDSFTIFMKGTVNQATKENLAQNDWMTCSSTISRRSPNLTLQHMLAKVKVTITSDEEVNEVRFFSENPNVPEGGTPLIPEKLYINPYKEENTYTAIVSANQYTNMFGYLPFMRIKVGDSSTEKWVYIPNTIGENGKLKPGNEYTFNVTVKSTNTLGTRSAGTSDCELELVEVRDMNE